MGNQIIRKSMIRALSEFLPVGGTAKMLLTVAFTVEIDESYVNSLLFNI